MRILASTPLVSRFLICLALAGLPGLAAAQESGVPSVRAATAKAKHRHGKQAVVQPGASPSAAPARSKSLLEAVKLKTTPGEMPDFVVESRPPEDQLHFVPLSTPAAQPASRLMTRDEIIRQEAELDAIRSRHDRIGGRKAAPRATASVAGDPFVPKVKKKVHCLLTCVIK